jgi:hypothetical protein
MIRGTWIRAFYEPFTGKMCWMRYAPAVQQLVARGHVPTGRDDVRLPTSIAPSSHSALQVFSCSS